MKHSTIINIYNFIRKSHEEPSRFIQDDFDAVKNQLKLYKRYGFPATYALKHDALTDERYIALLREYTDGADEIGAWWEITEELCEKAGVTFKGRRGETFDNRVNTAYSLGYLKEERILLVDAYMKDFYEIFGYYPRTIGSWVIDIVTLTHAHENYGVMAGAICRDQMATDGFTLWGGYVNGAYYPSKKNEYIPAGTMGGQLNMPVFRMLGPDPIRCFEEQVRESVRGVYTLEPSCAAGRDPEFISWMFSCLTKEDTIGTAYAQLGQENNFLWENMKAGLAEQMSQLNELVKENAVLIETMAGSAARFSAKYRMTPPVTYQASQDFEKDSTLKTMWYACKNYRVSFLFEESELFIRDLFVYREDYESRYLKETMEGEDSLFDALPLMSSQLFQKSDKRAKIQIIRSDGQVLRINKVCFTNKGTLYKKPDESTGILVFEWENGEGTIWMQENEICFRGDFCLQFTCLPVLKEYSGGRLFLCHNGFAYSVTVLKGHLLYSPSEEKDFIVKPEVGEIRFLLTEELKEERVSFLQQAYEQNPEETERFYNDRAFKPKQTSENREPAPPVLKPGDTVCMDESGLQILMEKEEGTIVYTLDGSEPDMEIIKAEEQPVHPNVFIYAGPFSVKKDCNIRAAVYVSESGTVKRSGEARCSIQFSKKIRLVESDTQFDQRAVFNKTGISGLIAPERGSTDYQDGNWLGTLDQLSVTVYLNKKEWVKEAVIGFITHHRAGILYPHFVTVSVPDEEGNWLEIGRTVLKDGPYAREIEKTDAVIPVEREVLTLCIRAVPYERFPDWCCYRGLTGVFTMADAIILR